MVVQKEGCLDRPLAVLVKAENQVQENKRQQMLRRLEEDQNKICCGKKPMNIYTLRELRASLFQF